AVTLLDRFCCAEPLLERIEIRRQRPSREKPNERIIEPIARLGRLHDRIGIARRPSEEIALECYSPGSGGAVRPIEPCAPRAKAEVRTLRRVPLTVGPAAVRARRFDRNAHAWLSFGRADSRLRCAET